MVQVRWCSWLILVAWGWSVSLVAVGLTGCGGSTPTSSPAAATPPEPAAAIQATSEATRIVTASSRHEPPAAPDPTVVLHTTEGDIKLRLYAQKSPRTVANFLENYANRGFYNQTIFHHVEPGVMLIGGGYTAELEPKPTRTPIFNESRNGLSNRRGTVAMIREPDAPHTATSQFFINLADNPQLDYSEGESEETLGYCVFGEVIEGMDIVERVAKKPTASQADFARIPSPPVAITGVERLR
jgi:cyclophilin family peptidyl-prolyl cis-trans isomerase